MSPTRHLGLDLGGTNIKLVVVERSGDPDGSPRVVATDLVSTHADAGPDAVTMRIIEAARAGAGTHGPVASVGVGVPGLFDSRTGVIELFPNLPGPWPGYPLRDRLADGIGQPVRLINDARAFLLAEAAMGAGRGASTLIGLTLGTGIGGAVIVDGRLRLGPTGTAGEIGHQTIDPDGPVCGCGNRGCPEVLAQAATIARLGGHETAEAVFDAARAGDPQAVEAVDAAARALGIAIANMITVLVPDAVVLGGGMAGAGEVIVEPIRAVVRRHAPLVPDAADRIVLAELGTSAGAIGAAIAGAGIGIDAVS
ncbi:MAG TPA: ROK family protein [Candidatus Limnocylindrales bacterium]|jgi:glucokinase